jgi:hypothetical protein
MNILMLDVTSVNDIRPAQVGKRKRKEKRVEDTTRSSEEEEEEEKGEESGGLAHKHDRLSDNRLQPLFCIYPSIRLSID